MNMGRLHEESSKREFEEIDSVDHPFSSASAEENAKKSLR